VYPLQMMHRIEQVRAGIVVLGNAAHTLHPVAGQGFNLSVRDIRSLTEVLTQCVSSQDFSSAALSPYAQRRALDQWRTVNASDLLPELFQYTGAVGAVRNFALGFMDLIPTVKQRFTAIAAGAVGEGDYV
jgi:2-octaprenyl-6-methoxyphenol hydroxylase